MQNFQETVGDTLNLNVIGLEEREQQLIARKQAVELLRFDRTKAPVEVKCMKGITVHCTSMLRYRQLTSSMLSAIVN